MHAADINIHIKIKELKNFLSSESAYLMAENRKEILYIN
jgi:hypothetical protein